MKLVLSLLLFTQLIFAAEDSFKAVTEQELSPHIRESIHRFCEDYSDPEQCALELGTLPLDQIENILGSYYRSPNRFKSSEFNDTHSSGSYSLVSYFSSLEEEGIMAHCESYQDPEQCILEAKALFSTGETLDMGHHSPDGFGPVEISENSFSVRDSS